MLSFVLSICIVLVAGVVAPGQSGPGAPWRLLCEGLKDPTGIDVTEPRFSWALRHTGRGQSQSAYRILVSTDPSFERITHWDSGRVESRRSTHVDYGGSTLASGKTYFWKVCYWDKGGVRSPYSESSRFGMGLLEEDRWKGTWIGGEGNLFYRQFTLEDPPSYAKAYVSSVGFYELYLNGQKVGRNVLEPGRSRPDKRVLYTTYDVAGYLREGQNTVGVVLGVGWAGHEYFRESAPAINRPYPPPPDDIGFLLQMDIESQSGDVRSIVSDESWRVLKGPIVSDSIFDGEIYDARLEKPGWNLPGYEGSGSAAAVPISPPEGELSAQMMPKIKVINTLVPLNVSSPSPGVHVFDMGQNFTGWAELRVRGSSGSRVELRFGETLYENGMINVENLRSASARDVYILRGGDELEVYEPRFTYHGGRYIEVTGYPGTPSLDAIRGKVVHTAVRPVGGFSSSNALLDRIYRNASWTIKGNLHSVPTDCPQRDERMGWMGDAHLASDAALFSFDMAAFYSNFLRNVRDEQDNEGRVPDTVPYTGWGRRPADPAWGMALPIIAWKVYEFYGDRRVLEDNYAAVKAWLEYLHKRAQEGILSYSYYGDWVAIDKAPGEVVSTAYYFYGASLLSRMARILGHGQDAELWERRGEEIRKAFVAKFFNEDQMTFADGSQGANALALYFDLIPTGRLSNALGGSSEDAGFNNRRAVLRTLTNDILYENDTHLTTGIHGTKYLMEILSRLGRSDLAYELADRRDYPSWGYMVANDATTIWELWQHKTGPAMNSHNHPAFGAIAGWMLRTVAGIRTDPERPGFEAVRIEPQMVRDLGWASGSVMTVRGVVSSAWRRREGETVVEVSVPVGSEADVVLPVHDKSVSVIEGEAELWLEGDFRADVPGVRDVERLDQGLVVQIGSGTYSFRVLAE